MGWLKRWEPPEHVCLTPDRSESHEKDVWCCDECGRIWRYEWDDYSINWFWAGPLVRWRYRKHCHAKDSP